MNSAPSPDHPEEKPASKPKCAVCGTEFKPYRSWQVYCSKDCRAKGYWLTHEVVKKEAK